MVREEGNGEVGGGGGTNPPFLGMQRGTASCPLVGLDCAVLGNGCLLWGIMCETARGLGVPTRLKRCLLLSLVGRKASMPSDLRVRVCSSYFFAV